MKKIIRNVLVFCVLAVAVYFGGQKIPYWNTIFISWLIVMICLGIIGLRLDRIKKKLEDTMKNLH